MKIRVLAVLVCLSLFFALPSYGATITKTPPPIVFNYWMKTNPENPLPFNITCVYPNSLGIPELKLFAVNIGKKPITAFEFTCNFTNDFGEPVYRVGTKNPTFKGIVQKTYLMPSKLHDSSKGRLYSFNLVLYKLATDLKRSNWGVILTRVKYSDGTVWTK